MSAGLRVEDGEAACPICGKGGVSAVTNKTEYPIAAVTGLVFGGPPREGRVAGPARVKVQHIDGRICAGAPPQGWVMP